MEEEEAKRREEAKKAKKHERWLSDKKAWEQKREAEKEETRLIRECEREVYDKESQGKSWGEIIHAFEAYLHSPKADVIQETTRADYIAAVYKHTGLWWKKEAAG